MTDKAQTDPAGWFVTRQLDAQTWAIDDHGQDVIYEQDW